MKMTVTEGYLVTLATILANPPAIFDGDCKGSVAMNIYLDREVANQHREAFRQAYPDVPEFYDYIKERNAVYQAAKVETVDDLNKLPEDQRAEVTKKVADLDAKFKDAIEKQHKVERDRREALEGEVTVELHQVDATDISIKTGSIQIPGSAANPWEIWQLLYADGNGIIRMPATSGAEEKKEG